MLKLIYTEAEPYLECLTDNLEAWVEQRLLFAIGTGEQIFVSWEQASFLLPDLVCDITMAKLHIQSAEANTVSVHRCDLDRVEIGLSGYWISSNTDSAEGIFVTQLPADIESYLWQLWCRAHDLAAASNGAIG
jgi:hypothetical protein